MTFYRAVSIGYESQTVRINVRRSRRNIRTGEEREGDDRRSAHHFHSSLGSMSVKSAPTVWAIDRRVVSFRTEITVFQAKDLYTGSPERSCHVRIFPHFVLPTETSVIWVFHRSASHWQDRVLQYPTSSPPSVITMRCISFHPRRRNVSSREPRIFVPPL